MLATKEMTAADIKHPLNLNSWEFINNKLAYYKWFREEAPVYKGKIMVINAYFVSRYEDCVSVLKDPRFVRNRSTATGGRRLPIPLPKHVSLLAESMIIEDEPNHRRLRNLVHKAFTPRALQKLEGRIETMTHELLDKAEEQGEVDLIEAYAHPIPVTVIAEMVGVKTEEVPEFAGYMKAISSGMTGWSVFKTLFMDLPKSVKFCKALIERKRQNPQDDILTALIQAEEDGEKLTEDELISMVFLLIVAGHETTVHLISNGVLTLLQHPEALARLRAEPELMDTAIEEIMRFNGPIHGTKPEYALEDVTMQGVTIPKGSAVIPLLGAANFDPAVFDNPERFDITRSPNRHLGFGQGIHYCLGAPLARMETKIALTNLIERYPDMRLAVRPETLQLQKLPGWHRYDSLPVILR